MNVLLINPKLKTWSPNVYPPLGLAYIASALENSGHSVRILDMNSRRVSNSLLINACTSMDIIGITGMITEYPEVVRLTELIKKHCIASVILGGPLATSWTEKILFESNADFAVLGEGERTIVELVSAITNHSPYRDIQGIAYHTGVGVQVNPNREPIKNLDTILFPARHLLDMNQYTTHHFQSFGMKIPGKVTSTTMVTSRGCPYDCIFCFKDVWGRRWRGRTSENILDEMGVLRDQYDYNGFVFNDDTFVVNRQRVTDFCLKLTASGMNINWYCNGRVNLMTKELVGLMAQSGCKGIAYGLESGNQRILDFIRKGITLEQVKRVTGYTKAAGVHVTGYFMLGMLGETKETIQETLDFARKLDLSFYGFTLTTPMPGTVLHRLAEEQQLLTREELEDWSLKANTNLTKDCTRAELESFNEQAFREFTLQKRYGRKYLLNPLLWLNGLRSLFFLIRKRNVGVLLHKVLLALKPNHPNK